MSNRSRKRDKRSGADFQLETLEKRILFSADLPFPVAELSSLNTTGYIGLVSAAESFAQSSISSANSEQHSHAPVEIVIIDSATPDYESIVADLEKQANSVLHVVILDADRDAIEQISEILAQYGNVGALHLISHGEDGELMLGNSIVDFTELLVRADEFAGWHNSFTADAELLIYGCDLASTDIGRSFVSTLGNLTGTEVVASDDLTGSDVAASYEQTGKSRLAVDHEHESTTVQLEKISVISPELPQPWQGVLVNDVPEAVGNTVFDSESVMVEPIALAAHEVRSELVFIDSGVEDYETLIRDIQNSADTSRNLDVVILDPTRDGVEQITENLRRYENLDAIHIVSHGDEGAALLGDSWLSNETLSSYENQLASWSDALVENADLLFYGCDLAGGENGEALIATIARLTDADVAASIDLTGSAILGGDWNLESETGDIETKVAFSTKTQQSWQGVLATFTVDTLLDTADANPGDGIAEDASGSTSIRAAIEEANALGGADVISVGAGLYTLDLGELLISSDIAVTGAGVDQTFIDGDALSRVFNITSGTITLSELTIQNGAAGGSEGGGVNVDSSANVTLDHVVLYNNTGKDGAAIHNTGTLVVQSSTIDGNTATNRGGGIHNLGSASLTDTTISSNSSTSPGGGVFENGMTTSLTNVTISGNLSADDGGGIYTQGSGVSLQNVTITDNTSVKNGGGITESGSSATLHNVIIEGNTGNTDPDLSGAFTSSGGNLIGEIGSATGLTDAVNDDQVGNAGSPVDALLGALADNGGPAMTHALLVGSSAIDGGTSAGAPTTDQIGIARNDGFTDIGAFEFVAQIAPTDLQVVTANEGGLSINEDGGNDAYLIADNGAAIFGGLTEFTIETRFSAEVPPPSNYSDLISYAVPTQDEEVWLAFEHTNASTSHVELAINGVIVETSGYNANVLFDGQQHTLTATWSSSTGSYEIFVDGASLLSGTGLKTGYTLLGGGELTMVRDQDTPGGGFDLGQVFHGRLHDLRIFDDIRSDTEIADNYLRTLAFDEPGMVANWTFDDYSLDSTTGIRIMTDAVSGNDLTAMNVGAVGGFVTSTPELMLAIEENSADGIVIGAVSGTDMQRDARIAALLAADSDLAYSAETGKFYRHVNSIVDFPTARDAATGSNLSGIFGQLVTIDSASENDLVWQYVLDSGNEIWLGASDAITEGEWNWLDGATESSEKFWSGGAAGARVEGKYAAEMLLSEGAAEDHLRMTPGGKWNDSGANYAYIVEWNADEVLDATDALTYTIQSQTVASAFAIDADSGVISVAEGSKLDYETDPAHTLTIRVTDVNGNIFEKDFTVEVNDLADDASWSVPIAQVTDEDTSFTFSSVGGNAIEITNGKPADQPVSASLNVGNGTLTLSGTAGITFLHGTGDGEATLVIFGTASAINTALDGLSYNPSENYHGSDALTVTTGLNATTEALLYSRFEFENGVITDQSGNGNHASLPGGTNDPILNIDPERGDVLDFDGDDKLTITNGTQGLGGELTIASWVNLNASKADNIVLSLADRFYIELDNHSSSPNYGVSFVAFGTGFSTASADKIDVAGDGWHHLAATFSDTNDEANLYVDGVLMLTFASTAVPNWGSYATQDIAIGNLVGSQPGSVPMAGSLDDVRIYNAALTENEVILMMGHQGYDADTVSITVEPVADTPSVTSTTTNEDTQSTSGLVISHNVVDGSEVSHYKITGITDGTLYKNNGTEQITNGIFITKAEGDAGLKFTPATDFNGTGTFSVQASTSNSDAGLGGNTTDASITVTPVNDAPEAVGDSVTVTEDTPFSSVVDLDANDTDTDGDSLSVVAGTFATNQGGSLVLAADGSFTYTPAANFTGTDSVDYTVTDGSLTDVGTLSITVEPVNDAPVITAPVTAIVTEEAALVFSVAEGNAIVISDVDDGTVSYSVSVVIQNGTATLASTVGVSATGNGSGYIDMYGELADINIALDGLIFVGATDFDETAKISIYASEFYFNPPSDFGSLDDSHIIDVIITPVNDAPVTQPDAYNVTEDGTLTVAAPGVLTNDSDPDSTDPAVVTQFGSAGILDGEFQNPNGIEFDVSGNLYVADYNNDRIQVFDNSGSHLLTLGSSGTADGQFDSPVDVAFDSLGNIYVADNDNDRIQKFDSGGTHLLSWGGNGTGDGQFNKPVSLAVDANNNVYVADANNHRVQKFDSMGNHLLSWGGYGTADGQFNGPGSIAIDGNGVVWVGESGDRIQQFDTTGNHLLTFGSQGSDIGELSSPGGITFDTAGNAYIADTFNQRVQVFDSDGNYRLNWGTYGTAAGELAFPGGIAVDATGRVWVADTNNDRIQIFAAAETRGESFTATVVTGPGHDPAFTLNADGSFTYSPETDWNGVDSFVYEADDGNGGVTQETVTITVDDVNDAPTGTTLVVAAAEETPKAIDISSNVADVDGTVVLSTTAVTGGPNSGSLTNNNDGTFSYTGDTDFVGTDSFTYTVEDNDGQVSSNITVTINVSDINDAPTGTTLIVAAAEETATAIDISSNVADVDGTVNLYTTAVTGGPTNGILINNGDGTFSYTGDIDFVGADSFTYTIEDNDGQISSNISVTINVSDVNDAPTGTTLVVTALEETTTAIDISSNVADVDGTVNLNTTAVTGGPTNGTLINNGDGTFSYTGDIDFVGTDSFTYTIDDNDGQVSSNITVTINVSDVNDAPTITSTAGTTATEDTLYTYTSAVTDPDDANNGTDLTWSLSGAPAGMAISSTGVVTWTPAEGVSTSGAVTLTVSDGNEDGAVDATEVFTISVTPVNDGPAITSTAGTTATEGTLYTYTATVTDPDDANNGTDLTWSLTGAPAGMVVSSTGVVTWTPAEGVTTSGAVTLTVSDGNEDGAVDATEVFTITVTPVNDAPTITSSAGTTATEDTLYTYTATVTDPDDANNGTDLIWSLSSAPAGMVVSSTGVVTWTPTEGVTSSGAVTLTVSDGNEDGALDATEVFTISVTPVNDGPTITSTAGTTATEDTLYTYTATVTDPDDANNGTDLTWSLNGAPAGMVVSSTGVVTWTPTEGVTTSGPITLKVSDGNEDGAVDSTEVFTITVTPVNDAPTITSTAGTTATEDTLYTYTATVTDPDDANNGTELIWSLSGAPAGMVVSNTGVVTWTPTEGVASSGAVTLTVSDGNEDGAVNATEVFTISVTPVNDGPTITSTAGTTATEDTLYTYTTTVTDPDDANNGTDLTWSLSGAPAGMVVSSTGVVTWTPAEGVTTSSAVTLTVSDGKEDGVVNATEVFTITVTPVNDGPTITSTAGTTATEDTLYTYTATVTDPDDANNGTDLTWSLSGAPAGMVVSSTGVVTWTPAEDVTTSGTVTLTVSDGNEDGAVDATEVFSITVTPVNDGPTITSTAGTTATEDTLYTYTTTVTDPDDANNGTDLTWSLSGAPAGMVVSSTGVVTWTPTEGVTTSGAVTLTVSDGNEDGAVDATEVIAIAVTPVNDLPVATGNTVSASEDVPLIIGAGHFNFSDTEGDSLSSVTITGLTLNGGTLTHSAGAVTVTNGMTITAAELAGLTFTSALNTSTDSSFTYTVNDSGTGVTSAAINITVDAVNDAPAFSSPTTFTLAENTTSVATLTSSDIDGAAPIYSLVGSADDDRFIINATTGELRFINAPDFENAIDADADNTYDLSVQVSDGRGAVITQAMSVTVNDVNEAPRLAAVELTAIEGFTGNIGQLITTDPDAGDQVTLSIVGGSAQAFFSVDPSSGTITQVSTLASGVYTLEVQLSDAHGMTSNALMQIRINQIEPDLGAATTPTGDGESTVDGAANATELDNQSGYSPNGIDTPVHPGIQAIVKNGDSAGLAFTALLEEPASEISSSTSTTGKSINTLFPANSPANHHFSDPSNTTEAKSTDSQNRGYSLVLELLFGEAEEAFDEFGNAFASVMDGSLFSITLTPDMLNALSSMHSDVDEQQQQADERLGLILKVGTVASVTLTVGFVTWLLQTGSLLATALSTSPLWRAIDPVPVLKASQDNDKVRHSGQQRTGTHQ